MDFWKTKKLKTIICFQNLLEIIFELFFTYIKAALYVISYFYVRAKNIRDYGIVYAIVYAIDTEIYFTEFITRIRMIHEYECPIS